MEDISAIKPKAKKWPYILLVGAVLLLGTGWLMRGSFWPAPQQPTVPLAENTPEVPPPPKPIHVPLPPEVRGIYWTAQTAGNQRGDELLVYMLQTGLNTAVIDLKMDDGELAFAPRDQSLAPYVQKDPRIADLDALMRKLADANIYKIARIAVMRDGALATVRPELALRTKSGTMWRDKIGSLWVDPVAPEVAQYAVALGREAFARGFDEVQYDYIRFASDGTISAIVYPVYDWKKSRVEVMQEVFESIGAPLRADNIPVSFDLFGMTFWRTDDFNIGQRLLDAWPYADFVSPMVYPSHFPDTFEGFANPALYPYEIVKRSMDEGAKLLDTNLGVAPEAARPHFRPWLQDFDIGAVYTAQRIEDQIRAARDGGASGWMLWNARNVYEPADYLGEGS